MAIIILQMGEDAVLFAQKDFATEIQYTTELQLNFKGQANWVNLLSLRAALPTEKLGWWRNGKFELQTISIYKTSRERLADDMQIFSNIEEDNLAISPFIMGYTQLIGEVSLFGGLRNVNEDYFIAPYTSLFTNSSDGIYPTISLNYPLANYPMSAVCLHMEYQPSKQILLKNSLYNGKAYLPFKRGSSVFTVSPRRDGLLDIAQISYTRKSKYYGDYTLGAVVHNSGSFNDVPDITEQAEQVPEKKEKMNYTLWASVEQAVIVADKRSFGLMAQFSYAPSDRNECYRYIGAGAVLTGLVSSRRQDQLGFVFSHAAFTGMDETALEITWNCPVTGSLEIQPAFHYMVTGAKRAFIGMLRIRYRY